MTVELTPENQQLIERVLDSGSYHDAAEVITAALDKLAEEIDSKRPAPHKSKLWTLRQGITLGDVPIRQLIDEGRE